MMIWTQLKSDLLLTQIDELIAEGVLEDDVDTAEADSSKIRIPQ